MNNIEYGSPQYWAIYHKKEKEWKELNSNIDERSGIYLLTRKTAYVGQAKNLLRRLVQHSTEYESHVDTSLHVHGLYNKETNTDGWQVSVIHCPPNELDALEKEMIDRFGNDGYYLYNITNGGQGVGKQDIAQRKPTKGYNDGKAWQLRHDKDEIGKLFDGKLKVEIDGKETAQKRKALEKFLAFIEKENL